MSNFRLHCLERLGRNYLPPPSGEYSLKALLVGVALLLFANITHAQSIAPPQSQLAQMEKVDEISDEIESLRKRQSSAQHRLDRILAVPDGDILPPNPTKLVPSSRMKDLAEREVDILLKLAQANPGEDVGELRRQRAQIKIEMAEEIRDYVNQQQLLIENLGAQLTKKKEQLEKVSEVPGPSLDNAALLGTDVLPIAPTTASPLVSLAHKQSNQPDTLSDAFATTRSLTIEMALGAAVIATQQTASSTPLSAHLGSDIIQPTPDISSFSHNRWFWYALFGAFVIIALVYLRKQRAVHAIAKVQPGTYVPYAQAVPEQIQHVRGVRPIISIPVKRKLAISKRIPRAAEVANEIITNPSSEFSEAFRVLRSKICNPAIGHNNQIIGLIPLEEKGHTPSIAIGLATTAALAKLKVLIVDFNLEERPLFKILSEPPIKGSIDVLQGAVDLEEVIHTNDETGIQILPVGQQIIDEEKSGLYERLFDLIAELRSRYDLIILVGSTLTSENEAMFATFASEYSLLLVDARDFSKSKVKDAIEALEVRGGRLDGAALL